jgi:hypothetical protein
MEYTIKELRTLLRLVQWTYFVWIYYEHEIKPLDLPAFGKITPPSNKDIDVLLKWWKYLADTINAADNPKHYIFPNKPNEK